MSQITNANPRVVFEGINDQSRGEIPREPESYPQHMPLLRLFTETGPTETTFIGIDSNNFNDLYGSETLNRRSKFFNNQSLLAETLLAEGNAFAVKRLKPEDAPNPSRITVAIDIVEDTIPKTTKVLSGFDHPDEVDNEEWEDEADGTVDGYRARIVLIEDNEDEVGTKQSTDGEFTSEDGDEQSTLYPLFELPASFFGKRGNLLGMRIWATSDRDNTPRDTDVEEEFQTRIYRVQFIRRDGENSSPVVIRTVDGSDYVDVSFTEGAYSETSDLEYYAPDVLIDAYEDDGIESGSTPIYSPFSEFYLYTENLRTVQEMIFSKEKEINPTAEEQIAAAGQIDVLTGMNREGEGYHSLILEGPMDGGVILGKESNLFATGGDDGTVDMETYEELVGRENRNFGQLDDVYENVPMYPFTCLYDTGLKMEGKYDMMDVLGQRRDLRVIFTTLVESDGRMPTRSEEISRSQSLQTRLQAYPESFLYGTGVCRAEVILQSGRLVGGNYRKAVPMVIDYAQRWAQMAGASNGEMREGADIDDSPNNRVRMLKNLNVAFFNSDAQNEIWESGATYTLSYDRRQQYYPAIRSVYNDDTSVLLSPITVSICCDIMRIIYRVHADLSGNAKLDRDQFTERSDNQILREVDGRYNERVEIVPRTYFTNNDDKRGFSWHCRVAVYANNPRTVMSFDLETYRMEDFDNG